MKDAEQYPFFVMLHHQNGGVLIMTDQLGDPAMYKSESKARSDALRSPLGENFGYEIFKIGHGES